MSDRKELAAELRDRIAAWRAGTCERYYDTDADLDGRAADALDAPAPPADVGVTRYAVWSAGEDLVADPTPEGEWVRYEDHAAALSREAEARREAEAEIGRLRVVLTGEPTPAMVKVGTEARWRSPIRDANNVREIWRAMAAAALAPDAEGGRPPLSTTGRGTE